MNGVFFACSFASFRFLFWRAEAATIYDYVQTYSRGLLALRPFMTSCKVRFCYMLLALRAMRVTYVARLGLVLAVLGACMPASISATMPLDHHRSASTKVKCTPLSLLVHLGSRLEGLARYSCQSLFYAQLFSSHDPHRPADSPLCACV